jgi:hypothetical protein
MWDSNVTRALKIISLDKPLLFMGLVVIYCFSLPMPIAAFAQSSSADSMVFTLDSALRGSEGELLTFTGDPPQPCIPPVWQPINPSELSYNIDTQGCHFKFHIHQAVIGEATGARLVGFLTLTVTNHSPAEQTPLFWTAWRHVETVDDPGQTSGILLRSANGTTAQSKAPSPWNSQWAWHFKERSFLHNQNIVYVVTQDNAWQQERWVRLEQIPYKDIQSHSVLGFRKFSATIAPKQTIQLEIAVPHTPAQIDDDAFLEALTKSP